MGLMAALTMTEDPKFLYKGVGRDQKAKPLFFGAQDFRH